MKTKQETKQAGELIKVLNKQATERIRMQTMIYPAEVPEPITAWTWKNKGFGPVEVDLAISEVPTEEPGRVCCILRQPSGITFDLAWREYGYAGSIRATYFIPS